MRQLFAKLANLFFYVLFIFDAFAINLQTIKPAKAGFINYQAW